MSLTPLIKHKDFYIKREDLNPTGSAKDRAIQAQIGNLLAKNFTSAVISSTGNAAISAAHFCQKANIPLTVFVSPKINPYKLKLIKNYFVDIITSDKPISSAFKFSKTNNSYNLRQSTDPSAFTGYSQIGKEIMEQLPQTTSIFVPTGSGTTLYSIGTSTPKNVSIFAVQPANNPTIASLFDNDFKKETFSSTDSLSAKFTPLKQKIIKLLKARGGGLVINDNLIQNEITNLSNLSIKTSPESAMAIAGFKKAKLLKIDIGKFPVVIFTGTKR